MNKIKKIILVVVILALGAFATLVFQQVQQDRHEKANTQNAKQVQVGMSLKEVVNIMGQPSWVVAGDGSMAFDYNSNHPDYIPIVITFNSNFTVKKIDLP